MTGGIIVKPSMVTIINMNKYNKWRVNRYINQFACDMNLVSFPLHFCKQKWKKNISAREDRKDKYHLLSTRKLFIIFNLNENQAQLTFMHFESDTLIIHSVLCFLFVEFLYNLFVRLLFMLQQRFDVNI